MLCTVLFALAVEAVEEYQVYREWGRNRRARILVEKDPPRCIYVMQSPQGVGWNYQVRFYDPCGCNSD
jgi:hypothetical protein